jgi:hypothetical protein
MPNQLDLFRQNHSVTSDPTNKLQINPSAFVGELPALLQFLNDLESVLNRIIPEINAVFGLNLPTSRVLIGYIKNLLRNFNLTGTASFLEQLIAALGGTGSALTDFFNAVNALAGAVQPLIDTIANALGHPGTGHTLLQLAGYLIAIPFGSITSVLGLTNLGADIQALLDLLSNVFGLSGVNHLLSDLKTLLGNIFGSSFPKQFPFTFGTSNSGLFPGLVTLTQWQQLLDGLVNDGNVGHTVADALAAFENQLAKARADISQAILDGVGGANLNSGLAQLFSSLFGNSAVGPQLSPAAVNDIFGGQSLAADVQAFLTGVHAGATGTGIPSISAMQQAINGIASLLGFNTVAPPPSMSVSGITQTNNVFIAQQAATRATYLSADPTGDPTFGFDRLAGATLPTMTITQTATVIGSLGTPFGGIKESVAWIGAGYTGSITDFYVNIYSLNTTTGVLTFMFQSPNLMTIGTPPSSSSTPAWYYYDFTTPNFITAVQGNWYAIELQVGGTGTYTLAGITHQAPAHPFVFPPQVGATRNPLATLLFGTFGTGATSGSGAVASLTTSHTPGATDNGAVVWVSAVASPGSTTVSAPSAVTYAGSTLTLNKSAAFNGNGTFGMLFGYSYSPGLSPLPQSANSVVATFGGAVKPFAALVNVDSFSGVGSFAVGVVVAASSTALAQASVASATGHMVAQAFGGATASAATTITVYNQTQDYNTGVSDGTTAGCTLTMGHAAGAATVSFSATSSATTNYAGIAIDITPGESITAPATIASPVGSTNYPFLELCGSAGVPQYPPVLTTFTSSGTYTIPTWATGLDIIALGGGGGGGPFGSNGGLAGSWSGVTLTAAQVTAAGATLAVTVGGGGVGGRSGVSPTNGGNSVVVVTGYGTVAGVGGAAASNGNLDGQGAGNFILNGETYYGGGTVGQTYGASPGGGGGMNGFGGPGFGGAPGVVFILAHQ